MIAACKYSHLLFAHVVANTRHKETGKGNYIQGTGKWVDSQCHNLHILSIFVVNEDPSKLHETPGNLERNRNEFSLVERQ